LPPRSHQLTGSAAAEFHRLADVPPAVEWFANLTNPQTRRAYEIAVKDFMRFGGIRQPEEFRTVTRAHVIAWRDRLVQRGLGGSTVRHRLASLFEYLCSQNAVTHNPVKGVQRPPTESGEGKTPALGDHQARKLLGAPTDDSIGSKRDCAILSTLLFHALRRDELCKLKVKDFRHARKGVPHLKVSGKGGKTRYLPLHPGTNGLVTDYLDVSGHGADDNGALFRPLRNNTTGRLDRRLRPTASTSLCAPIRPRSVSRSARMRCARPPPPMRSTMPPISRRCRSGSATPTSRRRASTITAARGLRIARRSR
jgi:integrase/recombinase XerD